MAFLTRWLQFLRFLEGLLEFWDFLTTPLGLVASVGLGLYSLLLALGTDAAAAATLAGSVALGLSCLITRPNF
ncbi:hypothetical protein IQ265_07495 [Nodosilinea sp. LEGE 06152]|uniref:hypothetical protein n=1 Tax=Nodosilinea sp. LEGE 06152 TaxID=2777966 RepID=UPI001881BC59|nr:hypothetical protein [Nodosilinea sp. LEGE 06152]MBE9156671.1 hypothetical protein [Nodosilinea sp. LEGE 06152]